MRPVSPQADLGDALQSWRNPSFLAPLGHLVSAEAPAGVIHRLVEPAPPPPTPGPANPTLALAAPAPAPKGNVVQRVLATITPWAGRESEPADVDTGPRAGAELIEPSDEPVAAPPIPAPTAVTGGSTVDPAPVQRSGSRPPPAAPALMTHAPSPALPTLVLPVVQTSVETAAQAHVGPGSSAEKAADAAPTLGMNPPPPASQPDTGTEVGAPDTGTEVRAADTGTEVRAAGSEQEPHVLATGADAPGQHVSVPTVQRVDIAAPAVSSPTSTPAVELTGARTVGASAPQEPAVQGVEESGRNSVPTLGADRPRDATQPRESPADLGQESQHAGPPTIEPSDPLTVSTSTVQRTESDMSVATPADDGDTPTLGTTLLPSVTSLPLQFGDADAVAADEHHPPAATASSPTTPRGLHRSPDGAMQPRTDPTVQRAVQTGSAAPSIAGPVRSTAAPRRLGLGPPLAHDGVTAQLSQATPSPPLVTPTVFPMEPASQAAAWSIPPGRSVGPEVSARPSEVSVGPSVGLPEVSTGPPEVSIGPSEVSAGRSVGPSDVPTGPPEMPVSAAEVSVSASAEGLPMPEVVAPLLGESAAASAGDARTADSRDAAGDGRAMHADAALPIGPTVQTTRDPDASAAPSVDDPAQPGSSPSITTNPPPLPVLRVHDASPSQAAAASASAPSASLPFPPPVVARLIGDRTPPLLTTGAPERSERGGASQLAVPVQRSDAGGAPAPAPAATQRAHFPAQPVTRPAQPATAGALSVQLTHAAGQVTPSAAAAEVFGVPVMAAGPPTSGGLAASAVPVWSAGVVTSADPVTAASFPSPSRPASPPPLVHAVSAQGSGATAAAVQTQTSTEEVSPEIMDAPALPAAPAAPAAPAEAAGPAEAGAPAQPAAATTGTAPPAAAGADSAGANPDELAKKLFDPLLRRLKTELRLDRERRGLLTDLRH